MKILVILQNMYSGSGRDTKAPLLFKINPYNHSGKRLYKLIEDDFWVTNSSSILSGGGAKSYSGIDVKFLQRAIDKFDWDLIIICGNQAKKAFFMCEYLKEARLLFIPHPAARDFPNVLFDKIRRIIKFLKVTNKYYHFQTIRVDGKYKVKRII
jgi:hypothetical protein